jgi:hypothetical protein
MMTNDEIDKIVQSMFEQSSRINEKLMKGDVEATPAFYANMIIMNSRQVQFLAEILKRLNPPGGYSIEKMPMTFAEFEQRYGNKPT